jgi:signal transduction histidine kinase
MLTERHPDAAGAEPLGEPVAMPASPAAWLEGGLAILDPAGTAVEVHPTLQRWLGLETGPAGGIQPSFWRLLGERVPEWEGSIAVLRTGQEPFDQVDLSLTGSGGSPVEWYRLEVARRDGWVFVRLNSALPPRTELAEAGWDDHLAHPSARREMFVRLMRAEAQLEKLTRFWPGVVFSQRPDFSFQFVTPQIEDLTGVSVAEWRQQPQRFWQVVHESDARELQQQLQQAVRSARPTTNTIRLRNAQTRRISYVLEHRQPVLSRGGILLGYEGVWLDVTRQTIAENRLSSAAWKETLAVLTMGLAHDFSNIMAGIHSLSETFLSQTEPEHPFGEGLQLIRKNSMQASQLVHRIINLHLGKVGERNYHDLNEVVNELQDLLRKIIRRRIQLTTTLAPQPLPIYVDAFELQQTIINLALNAADAMPQTGTLELRTALHTEWPSPAHVQGLVPRLPCVGLTVRDTGGGIKAQHLDLVFDPFFTTKSVDKGSGLGLYNARMFVEKHHGAVSVESVLGAGATFQIWLPQADFSETERQGVGASANSGRRHRLILLGAEGTVLEDTAEFLRTLGYHVVVVTTAENAAALLASGDHPYSGLVSVLELGDLGLLPHLATWRREHPSLRVVLKPVGCDAAELEKGYLENAELVIAPDLPPDTLRERLGALFEA